LLEAIDSCLVIFVLLCNFFEWREEVWHMP
jgi:hypothetical protein